MAGTAASGSAAAPSLVTGATGFIGNRLVARLRAEAQPLRALVLPDDDVPGAWDDAVEIIPGDIADPAAVDRACDGVSVIYHLAAVVGDWGPESLFRRVTVDGTRHVLDAAARSGARVVLASSIVVYGHRLGREVCAEGTPHGKPYGPYSRAKQAQEVMARQRVTDNGADIRVVRPANVYGVGSRNWVDEVLQVLTAGGPSLVDGGYQNAGLVHVENVVDVLLAAARDAVAPGAIFNACDELSVTWGRYLADLARLAGAPPPKSVPAWLAWPLAAAMEALWRMAGRRRRPPLTREALHLISADHHVSAQKARRELGHRSRVDYQTALAAIADSLAS
jgi:nucleoside-diphosphate-sugar epimerase